jgi:hypothetical protein
VSKSNGHHADMVEGKLPPDRLLHFLMPVSDTQAFRNSRGTMPAPNEDTPNSDVAPAAASRPATSGKATARPIGILPKTYYQIACACGRFAEVQAADAGTEVECPCGQIYRVPRLSELKNQGKAILRTASGELVPDGASPTRDRSKGWLALAIGLVQAVMAAVFITGASVINFTTAAPPIAGMIFGPIFRLILGLLGVLLAYKCRVNLAYGRSNLVRNVDEAVRRDERPPILLLRSFGDDRMQLALRWYERLPMVQRVLGRSIAFEEILEKALRRHGPVIAIGRPGDTLPPVGAARKYVLNDQWKDYVMTHRVNSQFVVVVIGSTSGVAWEIQQLAENGMLGKTILVLPPVGWVESDGRWRGLYERLRGQSGIDLPISPPEGALAATIDPAGRCNFETGRDSSVRSYRRAVRRAIKKVGRPGLP